MLMMIQPQPPMQNTLLAHLPIVFECQKIFPDDSHPHLFFHYIQKRFDLPDIFYMDWRPFGPKFLICSDPEVVSQYFTTGQSLPKALDYVNYLENFLGKNNMVTTEREHWKFLRAMFNPGFSAINIMTLTDYIIDASLVFIDVLHMKAQSNEYIQLEEFTTSLTIDIIGKVVLDADLNSQKVDNDIVIAFRKRVILMPKAQDVFPWQGVDLLRPFKLWLNARELERAIFVELDRKIERREEQAKSGQSIKQRSVVDLALDGYEKEVMSAQSEKAGRAPRFRSSAEIPLALRRDIIDQIKTFIFAGHDTTSSTICYILYLLHLHPKVFTKLKAELDTYFPPETARTADTIRQDPYIINKLEYTNAIIRETLRLFPPASTLRIWDPKHPGKDASIKDPTTGQRYPLANSLIWPPVTLVHRNERFFPEPTRFVPERHIQSQTPYPESELFTMAGKEAWRPFERGPRNCIGQEMALVEMRIIVALIVREFDFVAEYPGEESDVRFFTEGEVPPTSYDERKGNTTEKFGDRIEGYRMYQMLKGAAKPTGGCPGRVIIRE
jgi:cytochrome P450